MVYMAIIVLAVFVITCAIGHIWLRIEHRKYTERHIDRCYALGAEIENQRRRRLREQYGSEFAEKHPNFTKSFSNAGCYP